MAKVQQSIEIAPGDFESGGQFVESLLDRNNITGFTASATLMIYEALYQKIIEQNAANGSEITIIGQKRLGETRILIEFPGSMFIPDIDDDFPSPEDRILTTFADRIDYSYTLGFNTISITTKRKYSSYMILCLFAIILGLVFYYPFHAFASRETIDYLAQNFLMPFETLFGNAILMIGAPVTFFSLLKNLSDAYILSLRDSDVRKMRKQTFINSLIATFLAIGTSKVIQLIFGDLFVSFVNHDDIGVNLTVPEAISSTVPSNIFEPFVTINPLPIILLAILVTYSMCAQGRYFYKIRDAINACYSLFARMLSLVMYLLPLFTFVATVDVLQGRGYKSVLYVTALVLTVLISLTVLEVYHAIRIGARGINVIDFVSKLSGLTRENYIINSAIDAVPYNLRYCVRVFGMNRRKLESYLPVLAQINLEGNCFMLTLVSLLLLFLSGTPTGWLTVLGIGFLVLFLSMGAPNQPGGFVIGILIIINHLNLLTFVPMAIFCEVFFGGILNLINVFGDIVSVTVMLSREGLYPPDKNK